VTGKPGLEIYLGFGKDSKEAASGESPLPAVKIVVHEKYRQKDNQANDVMIKKKIFAEKIGVSTQNEAKVCKILIITLAFEKNANFSAENCRKL
jgi:hypothetical protein